MLALTAPIIRTPLITYLRPEDYDFEHFKELKQVDDSEFFSSAATAQPAPVELLEEQKLEPRTGIGRTGEELVHTEQDQQGLLQARNWALGAAVFIAISMTLLWPIPMYATSYIFSKDFFTGWIVVTFMWAFFGAIVITGLPLWESRRELGLFLRAVFSGKVASA